MFSEEFENELAKYFEKAKQFLMSRDLLVFLLFLFISSSLWVLRALNKQYETVVSVPLVYVQKPNGYIFAKEMPKDLKVTVVGQGLNLLKCRWSSGSKPIELNLTSVVNKDRDYLLTSGLIPILRKKLGSDVQVLRVAPDSLIFSMEKLAEKRVPVRVQGVFDLAQQYTYCDTMQFEPREVSVYGPQQVLDSISEVFTENVELNEIKDTMQYDAPLQKIPLVSCSDSSVRLHFKTERFTEKTIFAPISIINLPADKELKIFPSNVSVSFNVGLSLYDSIGATSFSFYVDYLKAMEGANRLEVSCKDGHPSVFGLKIKPSEVDYIIEMKSLEEKQKK